MRERLHAVMLVLTVGSLVALGARRAGLAYNVALVVVGLLLVVADVLPRVALDPTVVLEAFLPALAFEAALFADLDQLRHASRPILMLAAPGVAMSLLATAVVSRYALGLPFSIALLLGALLAITDTVSVLIAFKSVRVPHRLAAIMEGESLFNDGTALVLVAAMLGIATGHGGSITHAGKEFVLATVGGAVLGALFSAAGSWLLRGAPDHLTAILASLSLVFSTAIIAERVHASPVIAVVVAGLGVGRAARRTLGPSRVLALEGFWEIAGFGLNVLVFLLVGMQIDARTLWLEANSILLALVAMHAGRAAAVYGGFSLLRFVGGEHAPMRWQHVMVLGNIKGSLSMAAVLALPPSTPYRARLIAIVFGVTFVTLVSQGLPFRRFLLWLGLALGDDGREALDRARATLLAARRGQQVLDELLSDGLISRREHAERRADYQGKVVEAERVLRNAERGGHTDAYVENSLLQAQKAGLLDAGRRGVLSEEAVVERVEAIDDALLKLRHHEEGGS